MKSTDIIQPTAISQPIANTGTRNTISQNATGTGYASVAEGFPDVTMIAPADGGLPPRGEDCNGLFYLSTDQKAYLQNGGYITFNEEVSELIGGYPQGAILDYYNSDTNVWAKVISLIDDNTNNFVETPSLIDGTNWKYADIAAGSWGSITGTLSNQTDLQNELDTLQTNINTLESTVETTAKTLQTNINTLESTVETTAETLQTNINTLQTTVETDYLPLSGGTMTGAINVRTQNTAGVVIRGQYGNFASTDTDAPSSTVYDGRVLFYGSDNVMTGVLENYHNTGNEFATQVTARRFINSTVYSSYVKAAVDSSGNLYAQCPTYTTYTDSSTKICTTAFLKNVLSGSGYGLMTYSKSNNLGYMKFANGLIIQWGTSSGTITFATAMSNSSYCFLDGILSTSSGNQSGGWTSKSTTGCVTTYGSAGGLNWMVIGY